MRDPVKYCPICDIEKSRFNTHMLCADCESQALLWAAKMARSGASGLLQKPDNDAKDDYTGPITRFATAENPRPCAECGARGETWVLYRDGSKRWLCAACWVAGKPEREKPEPEKPLPCPFCMTIPKVEPNKYGTEYVCCRNKGCPMPEHEFLLTAWNRRAKT